MTTRNAITNGELREMAAMKRRAASRGAGGGPTVAELEALRRAIPADTRDVTAQILGDPLPGRSALDRRRAS